MPNIPVVVEEGATAVTAIAISTAEQRELVESIFRAVGVVVFVDEEQMHAVTALSGSGPAYIYMVIEALIAGGVKTGLSREVSTKLAEQTVRGAAKLVRETGAASGHPARPGDYAGRRYDFGDSRAGEARIALHVDLRGGDRHAAFREPQPRVSGQVRRVMHATFELCSAG